MMQYILAVILAAAVLLWVGITTYNQSAGERRIQEARAYAIEAQADADASATRMAAMYPALMIVGGTIVGIVWGVGFALRTRDTRPPQIVVLPRMIQPDLLTEAQNYYQELLVDEKLRRY